MVPKLRTNVSAAIVPLFSNATGGANLSSPVGERAKGIPRYSITAGRLLARWPIISPLEVAVLSAITSCASTRAAALNGNVQSIEISVGEACEYTASRLRILRTLEKESTKGGRREMLERLLVS
jgi:hypothetical protein